jgi:NtrC-family two-component system sensor histidine kinase KinB
MESETANPSASPPTTSQTQFQAQLYALLAELSSLKGQNRATIARTLFLGLTRITRVNSGRLLLMGDKGSPGYVLVLVNDHLNAYSDATSPPLEKQGLAAWCARQHQVVLISDVSTDPRWTTWREFPEADSAGSVLAVPIVAASRISGALVLVSDQPDYFGLPHVEMVSSAVDHAILMMENIHLESALAQTRNRLEALRQTAHALNHSLDLDQVIYGVLRQILQTLPYAYGMVLLQEEECLVPIAAVGLEEQVDKELTGIQLPEIFLALDQGRTITVTREIQQEMEWMGFPRSLGTGLVVPINVRRETLGMIIMADAQPKTPTGWITATANTFADHLAVAVAYHRLKRTTERRLRQLDFLNESGQAITATLDLERILQLLLERVREILRIDAASIALRDEQSGDLVFEAASGEGDAEVLGVRLAPGQGVAGWVAETGKPLVVQDAYNDARFYAQVDQKTGVRTQSILCIPIVLKGRVVGVIEALNPDNGPFDQQAIELLSSLAGLAATAIDNARLFARVQSAEARYAGLFQDSANPIILTDMRGIIVDANRNACDLLGQGLVALRDTHLTLSYSADDRAEFEKAQRRIEEDEEATFQATISQAGHHSIVEIRAKQIQVDGTPLIQWIGRDISAELELEQMREDLVHMVIHDLRNPLANIMNSLDVLQDVIQEQDPDVSQEELLTIAKRSGRRMHQLISSILDISRIEAGQVMLDTQASDLPPLLEEAIAFVKPQIDIRRINVLTEWESNLPQVNIDNDMILRVVLNLLENAVKFTPMDGSITVKARTRETEVIVSIADTGPGIPEDQLQAIFAKFTRIRHKNAPRGTGLGLAFCHLAVKAHGGSIWTESILEQGSTFFFTLPIFPPASTE